MDMFTLAIFLLILTNMVILGSSRIAACIRAVAVQGMVLGIIPLLTLAHARLGEHLLLAAVCFVLKGAVFPWLLFRALQMARVRREVEPFVGFSLSLLFGLLALVASFYVGSRLDLSMTKTFSMLISYAFFTIITGLFILVSRRKALSMVLGYLVLENGIYGLGMVLSDRMPFLVELGVLLDILVAVFAMGIATYQINREFDHTDVDKLNRLRG
ncbi:MAG: hydrogenase [Deltaproteobacteria bacterium]